MNKIILSGLISIFILFQISAQSFEDSRPFYKDISGYYGLGTGSSGDKDEALRLAKAAAINTIFREIKRDDIFKEICISTWPEAISTEEFSQEKDESGTFHAKVRIKILQEMIVMTEQSYYVNVLNTLNRAESSIETIDSVVQNARSAEENLRMSEAFILYKQVEAQCSEVKFLLDQIGDNSILSDKGNSRLIILNIVNGLYDSIAGGTARLEKMAREKDSVSLAEELNNTYLLLLEETERIKDVIIRTAAYSPFFDLPKHQLDDFKIEVETSLDTIAEQLADKFIVLKTNLPEDQIFLHERISLDLNELDKMEMQLKQMEKEIKREIRDPRLERQERAWKSSLFWRAVGNGAKWVFFHQAADIFTIRYSLPFEIFMETGVAGIDGFNMKFNLEKAFNPGIWVKTSVESKDIPLGGNILNSALTHEAAIGFYKKILFGAGYLWDWQHLLKQEGGDLELPNESAVKLYLGGIDHERTRPLWLLSLKYKIPGGIDEFIAAYHLNAALDFILRLENIMIIEAGISTECVRTTAGTGSAAAAGLEYLFQWNIGAAFRLPSPITWGITYYNDLRAEIVGKKLENATPITGRWRGFIQYSL